MKRLPEEDLQHIFQFTAGLWEELRNKSIFLTGGTGFFGKWFAESFLYINANSELKASLTLLTRNKEKFISDYPHIGLDPSVHFVEGDIIDFAFPEGEFSFVVHAAIDYKENSLALFDSCINGTRHTLDFAKHCHADKFLLVSSGAVYGKQPPLLPQMHEDYNGSPDPLGSGVAYGLAKRISEFLAVEYSKKNNLQVKIARCFAFAGAYLPLNQGSALGNFIQNALSGQTIIINGDGTPYRSYLDASDLMIWLWTMLFRGTSCSAYNVGSQEEISIFDLASEVISVIDPSLRIEVLQKRINPAPPDRYIPSIMKAKRELSLEVRVTRINAIVKMANWYKQ